MTFKIDKGTELGTRHRRRRSGSVRFWARSSSPSPPRSPASWRRVPRSPLVAHLPPYDVVQAFSDLSTTTDQLDVDQLAKALDTLARGLGEHSRRSSAAPSRACPTSRQPGGPRRPDQHPAGQPQKLSAVLNCHAVMTQSRHSRTPTVLFEAISARRDSDPPPARLDADISTQLRGLVKEDPLGPRSRRSTQLSTW